MAGDVTDANGEQASRRATAEAITTVVSVLLITALIIAIVYEGYAREASAPATLEATVLIDETDQRGESFYLPIEVVNRGDQTVEEALVAIEVSDGDTPIMETESTIATLGEAERATIQVILDQDPAGLTIDARVTAFQIAEE
jgi:uncharacterized protein (TIGR02588 family)